MDERAASSAPPPDAGEHPSDVPQPEVYQVQIPADRIDADAIKVLRRLSRYGHQAYLVGGSVRDVLLERKPKDFDIATSAQPQEMRKLFRNCRIVGRRFRLAHILFAKGKVIEVATFRREPEGRAGKGNPDDVLIRHDNVFGEPHEDAVRRDFTINGLFYDIEHDVVIDYVGGQADLDGRVIRLIGEPALRFREDPIRMLRALKFAARLDFGLDPNLRDALVTQRQELLKSAKPRLLEELLRLLRGGASRRSVYLCWNTGVLATILPELASYLDDQEPDCCALWSRLKLVDSHVAQGAQYDDALLLANLLWDPVAEALAGARRRVVAFEDFSSSINERYAMPRRLREQMRGCCLVQARLDRNDTSRIRKDLLRSAQALSALRHLEAGMTNAHSWSESD